MQQPQVSEKRASRRVPVRLTARCQIGNRFVRDPIGDLSRGGLFLKTHEPAREGIPVRIALALPAEDGPQFLTLVGSVARVEKDERGRLVGLGVSFSEEEIAQLDRAALDTFLKNSNDR